MRTLLATLTAMTTFCLVATTAFAQDKPFTGKLCGVDTSMVVKAPPSGADPNLAKYLGVYEGGKWSSGVCNGLVVSEVRSDGTATIRYIFPPTRDVPNGYFEKNDARLKGGYLYFHSLLGAEVWYKLRRDGSLEGSFIPKGGMEAKLTEYPKRL